MAGGRQVSHHLSTEFGSLHWESREKEAGTGGRQVCATTSSMRACYIQPVCGAQQNQRRSAVGDLAAASLQVDTVCGGVVGPGYRPCPVHGNWGGSGGAAERHR